MTQGTQFTYPCQGQIDVRLTENDEKVTLARGLRSSAMYRDSVHSRLEHGDATDLIEFGGVGFLI